MFPRGAGKRAIARALDDLTGDFAGIVGGFACSVSCIEHAVGVLAKRLLHRVALNLDRHV